ncbi:VPLPA-CTERM sorting domain-containing protein [Rhodovulum sp. DZ06]|uniref:VPLPA-CTERM sorting domain-containing protein n=1 Tax=Rhodovulum sp. DZ06 TaxID=3425126 RepID=UPI003D325D11
MFKRFAFAAALLAAQTAPAAALTFDLSPYGGFTGLQTLTFAEGTFTTTADEFYASPTYGVCAFGLDGRGCGHDFTIDFAFDVTGLTWQMVDGEPLDELSVSAYDDGVLLGTQVFTTETFADFSAYAKLDRLIFTDDSQEHGLAHFNFQFVEYVEGTTGGTGGGTGGGASDVPLPASAALLLGALGAAAGLRRKRG